jgi:hypothetical protein
MIPLLASLEIPTEVISVLFLLLISLANWLKNRVVEKRERELEEEEDPLREVIWRRQVGEEPTPWQPSAGPPPMPTIRVDPRPPADTPVQAPASPMRWQAPVVSQKEAALAAAFEASLERKPRRRTNHRARVDALLRSPSAAKDAILLTEILGPPVALKSTADS